MRKSEIFLINLDNNYFYYFSMILVSYPMKFFDENYSQEIPTCIKYLRKKYNLKQSDLKKLDFLGSLHTKSKNNS